MKSQATKRLSLYLIPLIIGLSTVLACKTYYFRSNYHNANALLHDSRNMMQKPYLKAHLKNGDICILKDTWQIDTAQNKVTGNGIRYDFNRIKKREGTIEIPIDSVAIFETNTRLEGTESGRIAALAITTGVNVILGIYCVTVPKACWGSCPTFYTKDSMYVHYADAEGFSNAISPSMEYADIDALGTRSLADNTFSVIMKNEALETHCVKNIKLLACPIGNGEQVFQSPQDSFYLCENTYPVTQAIAEEGDITSLLNKADRQERFSMADEHSLCTKEELYITFRNIEKQTNWGLVVNFRQTLMTTYLIYSAMGYMGNEVGDMFAKLETDTFTMARLTNVIRNELGSIAVYEWNEATNAWVFLNNFFETGPIAINSQIIPTKPISGPDLKFKLVLNKGLWRIDYIGLTHVKGKTEPVEISPYRIWNKGIIDNSALVCLKSPGKYLISMPGSEYKFDFALPETHRKFELFLYSKGYYLEWMRDHWIKDKNLLKLRQMVYHPQKYFRAEAGAYKTYENLMEEVFWNSRINTKSFSYDKN